MNIRILIAIHKEHWVPDDPMYIPIHVGKAIAADQLPYQGDDTGENISAKNPNYCELTAIYWAWKNNIDADYVGLVHYRRYFADRRMLFPAKAKENLLTQPTLERILSNVDVVVPTKRNYVVETLFSHYDHTHDGEHLRITGQVIDELCPDYNEAFQRMLQSKKAHMFNMFIMKKELFDQYCEWLFPILFEIEKRIDTSSMTPFEARYMGRISELLLNVWLDENKIVYAQQPYVHIGKVNWPKKISKFLAAKLKNEKYKQSF